MIERSTGMITETDDTKHAASGQKKAEQGKGKGQQAPKLPTTYNEEPATVQKQVS